ncbi:hypothetical protein GCM10023224_19200 [Streptomonospora halophila]|uniref:DUF4129 domain-containing protein n=1 Tax=Streptomonospora halophila TaxID=427369 RepID=A0ABP9GCP1_9ACTN
MDSVLPLVPVAVVAMIAVFVLLAFVLQRILRSRKAAQWSEWARENGWEYAEDRPDMIGILATALNPQRYKVQHVLSRTYRGRWVFTYEHLERVPHRSDGSHGTRYRRAVAVTLPAPAPKLGIGPETGAISMEDVLDLAGSSILDMGRPSFDAACRVTAADEDFARAVLTPEVMDRLLARHEQGRPPVRFNGHYLAAAEEGRLQPDEALRVADELIDLLEAVPGQVWHGGAARTDT